MKQLWLIIGLCALLGTAMAIDNESFEDPALQARYQTLTHLLRCPKCQNQTIAESPVGIADDLRRETRRMLLEGKSDQEILDFMSGRYGDFVLYKPPFAMRTVILWIAPALLLVGAFATVFVIIRRRAGQSYDDAPEKAVAVSDNKHNEADA